MAQKRYTENVNIDRVTNKVIVISYKVVEIIILLAFHSLFHSLHSYKDTFIVQAVQVNSIIDLLKFNHRN